MPLLFDSVMKKDIDYCTEDNHSIFGIEESVNYNEALISCIRATYEASMVNSLEIVNEGFTDMIISIKKWFVNFLRNFKETVSERFTKFQKYLKLLLFNAAKATRHKGGFTGNFVIEGYEYDLSDRINSWCVNDMISRIDKAINRIENVKSDLGSALTQSMEDIGSIELLDKYRGSMIKKNAVSQRDYFDALDMSFRKGQRRPKKITINQSFLDHINDISADLKQEMNECYRERGIIETNVKNILSFLDKRPKLLPENPKKDVIGDKEYISGKDINKAIIAVYTRAASSLKTTFLICEQFFNRKMIAISEALSFYNKCVNRANSIGSVKESYEPEEESATYMDMVDEELGYLNDEYDSDTLDQATLELFIYTQNFYVKEEAMFVEEAGGVTIDANNKPVTKRNVNGIGNRIADLIRRFVNFIGNMISKFDQALGDIFKTDIQWLRDNGHYFKDLPKQVIDTMTLTYSNYMHNNAHRRILERGLPGNADLGRIIEDIGRTSANAYKAGNREGYNAGLDCYRRYFKNLATIDPDNWKNAAMMYYRGRNTSVKGRSNTGNAETVTARGRECLTVLGEMYKYCINYKNYADAAKRTVEAVKNSITKVNNHISQLAKQKAELNNIRDRKMRAAESVFMYSVLGDSYIVTEELGSTSAAAAPQNNTGAAAGAPATQPQANQPQANTVASTANQGPTRAQKNIQTKKGLRAINMLDNRIDTATYSAEQVKAACTVCVSIGAAKISVCEEIFRSYMRVLRGVVDGIQQYEGRAKEDRENVAYNNEQRDKNERAYQARRESIKRRNQLIKDRRTGVIGAIKNIFGG